MASDLPPGCEPWMIPGNRPEDLDEEAFWEALYERLEKRLAPGGFTDQMLDVIESDLVGQVIEVARELAYERGLGDGRMEEQMAQAGRADRGGGDDAGDG